jgi:hypothetical protein
MPRIFHAIGDGFNHSFCVKNTTLVNEFVGFQGGGAVAIRDRRGTLKAEIPAISEKSETLGDDPRDLQADRRQHVGAAKAMGKFTGWIYAAIKNRGQP